MKQMHGLERIALWAVITVLFSLCAWSPASRGEEGAQAPCDVLEEFKAFSTFPSSASWEKSAPQVKAIEIKSSADSTMQSALYYDSGTETKKPLLVVLHSWSEGFRQKYSIPYAIWSVANDWVFIHPDYRGAFNGPEATGSELAVRDILDAVEYARENANVDESRIYLSGFSGGAMMSLVMAARYPEMWTAVTVWGAVFDLADWYRYVTRFPNRHYSGHIVASCGGVPLEGSAAEAECRKRSPSAYLGNAAGKQVRIYMAHGIHDDFALPGNALKAFNELAAPEDRIPEEDIEYIDSNGRLPEHATSGCSDELYEEAGRKLLFRRSSGNAIVSLFDGEHDMLYSAGLQWLSRQVKEECKTAHLPVPVSKEIADEGGKTSRIALWEAGDGGVRFSDGIPGSLRPGRSGGW